MNNNKSFSFFLNNPKSEDECLCDSCRLVQAYFNEIINAESYEEIEDLLHGLVDDAFRDGYTEALQNDIKATSELLNSITRDF